MPEVISTDSMNRGVSGLKISGNLDSLIFDINLIVALRNHPRKHTQGRVRNTHMHMNTHTHINIHTYATIGLLTILEHFYVTYVAYLR